MKKKIKKINIKHVVFISKPTVYEKPIFIFILCALYLVPWIVSLPYVKLSYLLFFKFKIFLTFKIFNFKFNLNLRIQAGILISINEAMGYSKHRPLKITLTQKWSIDLQLVTLYLVVLAMHKYVEIC